MFGPTSIGRVPAAVAYCCKTARDRVRHLTTRERRDGWELATVMFPSGTVKAESASRKIIQRLLIDSSSERRSGRSYQLWPEEPRASWDPFEAIKSEYHPIGPFTGALRKPELPPPSVRGEELLDNIDEVRVSGSPFWR